MPPKGLADLTIERGGAGITRRKRRYKRWVALALLILVVAVVVYKTVINPVPTVSVASVTLVHPSSTFTVLSASGYVVAQRKAAVASKGTGRLVWLGVEEGSRVTAGQVIARLESDDLRAVLDQATAGTAAAASSRDAARAQIDAAKADRDNAVSRVEASRAALEQARAEADDALAELERTKSLVGNGIASRSELDAASTRLRFANAGVESALRGIEGAQAAVRAAESAITAAESSLAAAGHQADAAAAGQRAAAVNAAYTEIRAPFDGVVLTKNADIGDMVTPISSAASARAAVVTIADPSSLLVEADVAETSLGKVRAGQPCEVLLDSLPDVRFPATLHTIVPTADRAKGTVLAKIRFDTLDPRILPEMSAKVAFLSRPVAPGEVGARVAVPPKAVARRDAGEGVFLIRDGRAVFTRVGFGQGLGDMTVVLSGLSGGERVVISPPTTLRDGARVKVAGE
jgi:RND family efflux transporter MFP subunit